MPYICKPPHPNLPPPDRGRDKVAVTERGRLKNLSQSFQTTSFVF
ncbi:hypothetical protein HMPREF9418_0487 [Neisseria macacae ATCC 33926]|uniref:Uncharacterized protein n=1 Tax=Neisseria macacae ATCC 33926 TaxID=997348 RepID=A0AA36XMQ7_9NEIS|nr:hypothetical protein HMPREF9418_0487 [Neisseria macacae ATCC 33926]